MDFPERQPRDETTDDHRIPHHCDWRPARTGRAVEQTRGPAEASFPEWPVVKLVFLGDLVDRNDTVKELVSRIIELIAEKPGSTCVMGNHDLALVKAAGLDGPPSESWTRRYADNYDHVSTFISYLGKEPQYYTADDWRSDLRLLREAIPPEHCNLLVNLPWVAEAEGHIFLHNGLSPELDCPPSVQLECLKRKV